MKKFLIVFAPFLNICLVCYENNFIDYANNDEVIKYENDSLIALYNKTDKKFCAYKKIIQKHKEFIDDIYLKLICFRTELPNAERIFYRLADQYDIQQQERGEIREPDEMENRDISEK